MSKISVIIPAYGVEPYLERCLDSLLRQTHRDFEAIVVDDASPDGCGAIAERYAAEDERFVVVHHETNQGLHLARVSGVERATGDYVFFLDGDDELEKSTLSSLARVLDETGADVAHLGMSCVAEAGVSEEDLDDLASLAGRAEGSELSLTIREQEDGTSKVSVRSSDKVSSRAICEVFGGGGHERASGCTIYGDAEKAREMLLNVIDEVWK